MRQVTGRQVTGALALAAGLLLASESWAQVRSYTCTWLRVGQPFTLAVDGAETRIAGSLAIFGDSARTLEDKGHYVIQLQLAKGFVVFRWPQQGGASAVGFFNETGQLQGGYQRAAQCRAS